MPTYTVHQPPAKNGRADDPARFVFVRDGFHFWAFLLTLPWLVYRRLWLALLGYVLLTAAMSVVFHFMQTSGNAQAGVALLIGLLFGLEAASLRRWTYRRRGWSNIGVVVGDDAEDAERRFFAAWIKREPQPQIVRDAAAAPTLRAAPVTNNDILGLFPQPERRP